MHIAFDVDGVLYDFVGALAGCVAHNHLATVEQREAAANHNYRETTWDCWTAWGLTRETIDPIVRSDMDGVFGHWAYTSHGYREALQMLMERGHRVDLITREWPTAGDQFREVRTSWMLDTFSPLPHGIVFCGPDQPKTDFAFDLIIEDHAPTAIDAMNAGRKAIVVDQPWNRAYDIGTYPPSLLAPARDSSHMMRLVDQMCGLVAV